MEDDQFERFVGLFSMKDEDFPYNSQVTNEIQTFRKQQVDSQLFFDVLLSFIEGIEDPSSLYPPKSIDDLQSLFMIIENSNIDELKQQCFYYYLLKDWEKSETYSEQVSLPKNYQHLMDGYYYLDRLKFEEAINHLLLPDVLPNFPDKIIETLYSNEKYKFLIRFVSFVGPPLDTFRKEECYALSLVRYSFLASYHYMKKCTKPLVLWEEMIQLILESNDTQSCKLIVSLPLSQEECEVLFSLLRSKKEPLYLNTLLALLVESNNIQEALELSSNSTHLQKSAVNTYLHKLNSLSS
ncbi:hypothetical protein POMI540_0620 [Schizosaccharomyces pombe]